MDVRTNHITYIDIAKAVCIILVVVGHFNPVTAPGWWADVFRVIYSFHMPVFMFLSGLLYSLTRKPSHYLSLSSPSGYGSFVWKKFRRLMIPYFVASIVIIAIKFAIQSVIPIKNAVSPYALVEMFWKPSAAIHLWFLWTLMLIFLIVPLVKSVYYRYFLLVVSSVLWIADLRFPGIFALDKLPQMMVFFLCGDFAGEHKFRCGNVTGYLLVILFAGLEAAGIFFPATRGLLGKVLPFLGIVSVVFLSRKIASAPSGWLSRPLLCIGRCSFFIYLFHTTFAEITKVVLAKVGITTDNCFVLCLLAFTVVGIAVPMLIQIYVVERSAFLASIFGTGKAAGKSYIR